MKATQENNHKNFYGPQKKHPPNYVIIFSGVTLPLQFGGFIKERVSKEASIDIMGQGRETT